MTILVGWPRIWAKVTSEGSVSLLWKNQFEHFGGLAADISKSIPRKLSFSILAGWPRIWAKLVSEASVFWWAGRGYWQKLSQKILFEHWGEAQAHDLEPSDPATLKQLASKLRFVDRCGVSEPRNLEASDLKVQICAQVFCF